MERPVHNGKAPAFGTAMRLELRRRLDIHAAYPAGIQGAFHRSELVIAGLFAWALPYLVWRVLR